MFNLTKEILKITYSDIISILKNEYPMFKNKAKLYRYADEILESIDWDNEVLMHKGLKWITIEYMKRRGIFNEV